MRRKKSVENNFVKQKVIDYNNHDGLIKDFKKHSYLS